MKVLICLALFFAVAQSAKLPAVPVIPKLNWDNWDVKEKWADFHPEQAAHKTYTGKELRALCGTPNAPANRIVSGVEAIPNQFPWVVGLFMNSGSFCTGALISDQWVMTAAHCQDGVTYTDIYLGSHNVRDATQDPNRLVVRATTKSIHPNWNANTLNGDIALIRLPAPVDISGDFIRPICLQSADDTSDHTGDTVLLSGWGKTTDASTSISPTLQKTQVTVIANTACRSVYGSIITDNHICTSVQPSGTCNGDSGSSMGLLGADGRYSTIGVTSFVSGSGCQSGLPDGFTRVSGYLGWISTTTGITF